jgi:hypothetical protein
VDPNYREGLQAQIDSVFRADPTLPDHRHAHPWLTGAFSRKVVIIEG